MCDYSLMAIRNRLATEGDRLVAHRFASGTTGLVSVNDFNAWQAGRPKRLWAKIKNCFAVDTGPAPVVCVPPGAQLLLEEIPRSLREQFHLNPLENATFTQLSAQANRHRDGLLFSNGTSMLLQLLPEGQTVRVLRCSSVDAFEPSPEEVGIMQR
jgi:hypothetical protein